MSEELTTCIRRKKKIADRKLSQGAILNKEVLGKSIVADRKIEKGETLTIEAVSIKSPGQGLPPSMLPQIIGKKFLKLSLKINLLH